MTQVVIVAGWGVDPKYPDPQEPIIYDTDSVCFSYVSLSSGETVFKRETNLIYP